MPWMTGCRLRRSQSERTWGRVILRGIFWAKESPTMGRNKSSLPPGFNSKLRLEARMRPSSRLRKNCVEREVSALVESSGSP